MSCSFRTPSIQTLLPSTASKTLAFYAVILHDFVAECLDKLGAKAGDSILVVVQSNRKWFVAKLIGRLGKPGLILSCSLRFVILQSSMLPPSLLNILIVMSLSSGTIEEGAQLYHGQGFTQMVLVTSRPDVSLT